jgi:hypothetical protein
LKHSKLPRRKSHRKGAKDKKASLTDASKLMNLLWCLGRESNPHTPKDTGF